jgi:hypothetical protein
VEAAFTSSDPNWEDCDNSLQPPPQLTVLAEDASRLGDSFWTGEDVYWTATPTSDGATVTLAATFKDVPDGSAGDVRAANISFYTGPSNIGPWTKVGSAQYLQVGLVNLYDGTIGTAGAIAQFNLKSTELNAVYFVKIVIGGAYTGTDVVSFAVARAKPGQIFGTNASLGLSTSTGFLKGRSQADFSIVYTKSGTNPQGKASVRIGSWYKSDGTLDTTLHYYQVDTNSIASLSVSGKTATFSAKATVKELFFDQAGNVTATTGLDAGATLQLAMTDGTSGDTLAISIMQSKKNGGLWYSNRWDGTKTVQTPIVVGSITVQ